MKRIALLLLFATPALLPYAGAQTPATAAHKTAAKPAVSAAKHPAAAASGIKLPPGVPPARGVLHTAFALRYQEIKVGTGKPAEPGKYYSVHYTGWLASDGQKFDSSYDHRRPVLGAGGQPELDADGNPKLGEPEPIQFPQGRHGVIPGWDQGFEGMKVGGKRRLFIPYQLAYGELGRPPVIPPKSDLIFDIELMDVTDQPTQQGGQRMPSARPMPRPGTPGTPTAPATPAPPAQPAAPTAPAQPSPTAPPEKPVNPEQPR